MKKENKLALKDLGVLSFATLFGIGYTPMCPGTASCVLAVLFFILIKSKITFLLFTLVSIIIAFYVSGKAEKLYGQKDCKKIVIDDFAGQLLTLLFIPKDMGFIFIVAGFFLFRMLDMLKIPPANKIENLHGSKGIVGDDLVAGAYACVILHVVRALMLIG